MNASKRMQLIIHEFIYLSFSWRQKCFTVKESLETGPGESAYPDAQLCLYVSQISEPKPRH